MDEFDLVMKRCLHGPEANSTTLEKPHYDDDDEYIVLVDGGVPDERGWRERMRKKNRQSQSSLER